MEREGKKREEQRREIQDLLSSVNKLSCVYINNFGWLDNKDSNIELL